MRSISVCIDFILSSTVVIMPIYRVTLQESIIVKSLR